MKIFSRNPRAAYFRAVYIDAFAGTGFRKDPSSADEVSDKLFSDVASDTDAQALRKGSTQVALETEPPFAQYVFIEHTPEYARELARLRERFPTLLPRIQVVPEDANEYLMKWCQATDWGKTRAVVFLDPYGMQVKWAAIAAMGSTQGIDLWILFPLGVGVNRLLLKGGPPRGPWADRLTSIFGTDEWQNAFYKKSGQQKLFGGPPDTVKDTDFNGIAQFWVDRLKTIFPAVAPNPLPLRNSKGVPIYLLSFAAANPKGGKTAVKIAQDILSR